MQCGSGMTCWRRLRDWQEAGVWQRRHELLLSRWHGADRVDWARAAVDSASIRAVGGGEKTGSNPTDRPGQAWQQASCAYRRHAQGTPLAAILTGANLHDAMYAGCCPWWTRRRRCGDGRGVGRRGFTGLVLMLPGGIGKPCGGGALRRPWPGAGRLTAVAWGCTGGWWSGRWGGWLHQFRRLRVRYERRADIHEAFLALGCSLIYFSSLPSCAGASPVPFSSTP